MESSYDLNQAFTYDKICQCAIKRTCSTDESWHILIASHVIDLVDTEVGMWVFFLMRIQVSFLLIYVNIS